MQLATNSPSTIYAEVGRRSQIEGASPHKLIELLLENAITRISTAKTAFSNGDIELRGRALTKAVEIVTYLRSSLDLEKGDEIAANLHDLYLYVEDQLIMSHANETPENLDHVSAILTDLLDTWKQIKGMA